MRRCLRFFSGAVNSAPGSGSYEQIINVADCAESAETRTEPFIKRVCHVAARITESSLEKMEEHVQPCVAAGPLNLCGASTLCRC